MRIISVSDCSDGFLNDALKFFYKKAFKKRDLSLLSIFFENSTRTLMSFKAAAELCDAKFMTFDVSTSSIAKDEGLIETVQNLNMYKPDCVIMRTKHSGEAELLSNYLSDSTSVVNAGDGIREHPTQGMLDLFTVCEAFGIKKLSNSVLSGLEICICGDIMHSRVAGSDIRLFSRFGARITLVAPPCFLSESLQNYYRTEYGCKITCDVNNIIPNADIIMMLRIQKERSDRVISGFDIKKYSINQKNYPLIKKGAFIMHPGPFNHGVEITKEIAFNEKNSLILKQTENGMYTRAAIFSLI